MPRPTRNLLSRSRALLVPVFACVALAAVGCGRQTTTPGPESSDPIFVSVPQDGTDTPLTASALRAPIAVTRRISALTGGTIAEEIHREIARLSKGAYCPFDAGSAKQLVESPLDPRTRALTREERVVA